MLTLIIFILFLLGIDLYSFFGLRASIFSSNPLWFNVFYAVSVILTAIGIVMMYKAITQQLLNQSFLLNISIGIAFSLIIAKIIIASMFLSEDIMRIFLWLFQSAFQFRVSEFISRSFAWSLISFTIGSIMVLLLNYGVLFGKYHYKVHKKVLYFDNLPNEFEGFKIAQLSDLHLGTFDSRKRVQKGFDLLQKQNPDIILFTGDMVNNKAEEALPYIKAINNLHAPYGKYTILGNHDYGDYVRWKNKEDKKANLKKLEEIELKMGLQWLNNKHTLIKKGSDTIYIAGVENWGLPPFPQHGKLEEALDGLNSYDFIVLLSHDPTHWREEVLKSDKQVELTLSGHTHGMQFGFELGKYRWSPVKYKYKNWADLFISQGKYLYVNRGFGNIGYPGRLGIRPEITIIELRKTQ